MSEVFISYAREDRDQAERLARVFEQQNWTVWWDKVIPPGGKYADVIGAELQSAKAVIVLWSSASVASDWVKDEAQEGANRHVLVPALIEKVSPPYGFRQVQTADLSDWDGSTSHAELQSLERSVGVLIQKPVTDSPLPTGGRGVSKRPYLFAGAFILLLLLGYAAYRFINGGPEANQNQGAYGNRPVPSPTVPSTTCNNDSKQKAAELTGKGMTFIDPGGNRAAAVLQFNEALSECPDYTDAYFWRGQSYAALQKTAKAVADFKKVLELTTDADMRQEAQKFLAALEAPPPTPVPTRSPGNTNTIATNTNNTSTPNNSPTPAKVDNAQVNDMFAADKSTRINATTRLIIERKKDAGAVRMSIMSALAHPENKSGVINTLVYLENVDPVLLKQNRPEIEKLFALAKGNGDQTVEHIKKVDSLLNH
jgi:tetratricopeptide (TPR) repeat protein